MLGIEWRYLLRQSLGFAKVGVITLLLVIGYTGSGIIIGILIKDGRAAVHPGLITFMVIYILTVTLGIGAYVINDYKN